LLKNNPAVVSAVDRLATISNNMSELDADWQTRGVGEALRTTEIAAKIRRVNAWRGIVDGVVRDLGKEALKEDGKSDDDSRYRAEHILRACEMLNEISMVEAMNFTEVWYDRQDAIRIHILSAVQ
jgi:hypothetical protein